MHPRPVNQETDEHLTAIHLLSKRLAESEIARDELREIHLKTKRTLTEVREVCADMAASLDKAIAVLSLLQWDEAGARYFIQEKTLQCRDLLTFVKSKGKKG